MKQMKFNTRVKYKGAYWPALEPFDVDDADVPEMQARGGVVIVESRPPKTEKVAGIDGQQEPPKTEEAPRQKGKKKAAGDV